MKLNQSNIIQYLIGNGPTCFASTGIEIRYSTTPPRNKDDELRTNGLISLLLSDIITLLPAVAILPVSSINTPKSSSPVPNLKACRPTLIRITPEIPKTIVMIFFLRQPVIFMHNSCNQSNYKRLCTIDNCS